MWALPGQEGHWFHILVPTSSPGEQSSSLKLEKWDLVLTSSRGWYDF